MGATGRFGFWRVSVAAVAAVLIGVVVAPAAGAGVTASAGAAVTATATKLSIVVSASEVDASTGVTIRGKLFRAWNSAPLPSRWVSLYARQHNQSTYRLVARAATNANGDYSFSQKPTWSTVYQTRFAGGPSRDATSSSYKDVRVRGWYYLTDLPHVDTYSDGAPTTGGGTYRVGGVAYPHSLSATKLHLDAGYEWDQMSACSRLDTKYGIDDQGASTSGSFQVLWDRTSGSTGMSPVLTAKKGAAAKSYVTPIATHHLTLIGQADSTFSTMGDAIWASARVHCIW